MVYPRLVLTIAERTGCRPGVAATLLAVYAALFVGSIVRVTTLAGAPPEKRAASLGSLGVWWVLSIVVGGALVAGRQATAVLFAFAGLLAIREFLSLTLEMRRDRVGDLLALLAVPSQFLIVLTDAPLLPWTLIPVFFFLVLPIRLMLTGTTVGYLHDVGTVFWGVMLSGFALSHTVLFMRIPESQNGAGGWAGWILFLVLLTEGNDIAQALWGRQFGRHQVTPTISPRKTWEGLLFGIATTVVIACLLGPHLTPFDSLGAGLAGAIIAVAGFFGDINMSAFKRDLRVKDSGTLLPGQGGILDRVDSLSFSAPLFYYYVLMVT